jgi:WD40 repeat protein
VLNFPDDCQVVAYGSDLRREPAWRYTPATDEQVTALAIDPDAALVVFGTNSGSVTVLDAGSGRQLVRNDSLRSTVLSLAVAGGRYIAAGLQDGQVAYLEYAPQEEEVSV